MLTHEVWVNGGRYESLFGAPPPANPARDTKRRKFRKSRNLRRFVSDRYAAAAIYCNCVVNAGPQRRGGRGPTLYRRPGSAYWLEVLAWFGPERGMPCRD
jgi:hypothetical protein